MTGRYTRISGYPRWASGTNWECSLLGFALLRFESFGSWKRWLMLRLSGLTMCSAQCSPINIIIISAISIDQTLNLQALTLKCCVLTVWTVLCLNGLMSNDGWNAHLHGERHCNRFRYREWFGHWNRLHDRIWCVNVLHYRHDHVFGHKLCYRQRLKNGIRLRH